MNSLICLLKNKVLLFLRNEVSKLASIFGCEIDRAKREYPIDTDAELRRIRNYIASHLILYKLFGSNQAKAHDGGAGQYRKTIMDILYNSHKNLLLELFSVQKMVVENKVS